LNQIFQSAAKLVQILCNATRIKLDPPKFHEQYVSFPLSIEHEIEGDFFIRAQSVGITLKGEDVNLFYFLQAQINYKEIEFEVLHERRLRSWRPLISGDGKFDKLRNPCTFYLASISSGNLKDVSDLPVSRDPATFDARAEFLANLLFTQWIVKMMPHIETYKDYKRLNLLAA
jgi:hypothetical protein